MKRLLALAILVVMLVTAAIPGLAASDDALDGGSAGQLIREYFSAANEHDYDRIIELSHPAMRQLMRTVYSSEVNRENNIGLFNVKTVALQDIAFSMEAALTDYYDEDDLDSVDSYEIALVSAELEVNVEQDGLTNGDAYFCVIIAKEAGVSYVWNVIVVDAELGRLLFSDVQPHLGLSTPTNSNILSMPTSIKVYRANVYTGEDSSVKGTIETVNFETYCKICTQGEFGDTTQMEALKAVAVAVRTYAFHRYLYSNSLSAGFHIIDSGSNRGGTNYPLAQYYNPLKTPNANVISAVNSTRKLLVLDASNKMFPTPHNRGSNSANGQNSGVLSQLGAAYLASTRGYTCEQIIHYFYDRVSSVTYYNTAVAVGAVSLHAHTNAYTAKSAALHTISCAGCGNTQTEVHTWYDSVESGRVECLYCGYAK